MDLKEMSSNENRHPWELSRSQSILNLLSDLDNTVSTSGMGEKSIADIGAGDKFFTQKLHQKGFKSVFAIDTGFSENEKNEDGIICLNNIDLLPDNSLDFIILMDILEHIEKDTIFFVAITEKLKKNGIVIITVPAWQFLFSDHDVFLEHYRRYNRKGLLSVLNDPKMMKIMKCHYFYTTLFFARLLGKILKRPQKDKIENTTLSHWKYPSKSMITGVVKFTLNTDYKINSILNKIGIRMPGLSLLAVCQKRG